MISKYEARVKKITKITERIISGKHTLKNPEMVVRSLETLRDRLEEAIDGKRKLKFLV